MTTSTDLVYDSNKGKNTVNQYNLAAMKSWV